MNVMIVEDEIILASHFQMMVEAYGDDVVGVFPRATRALQQIEKGLPDLLLVDIRLQDTMTGIDLVNHLKQQHDVKFAYISGNSDKATYTEAMATGPIDFLVKPITADQLHGVLDKARKMIG